MLKLKSKVYNRHRYYGIKPDGFTMIEIIVALVILSTSLLAVFGTLRACSAASNASQRLTESVLLAEKLLSEITLNNKITYQTTSGNSGIFTWQIQTAPTELDNLAVVSVQIQWLSQQKPQEYRLCSLIYIPILIEGK
jgi:prepilin-type N-terminal cleavage/methylation domain-containing protein